MYNDDDIFTKHVGMDGVMYLKFLKYSMYLCIVMAVLGNAIITPINFTGGNQYLNTTEIAFTTGLDQFSLANVSQGSHLMWVHLVSVFIFSILIFIMLYMLYYQSVKCQIGMTKPDGVLQRSILAIDLPPGASNSSAKIRKYFERMYGSGSVHNTLPVPRLDKLCILQNKRADAVKKKESRILEKRRKKNLNLA